jgi:AraC-like DNA-binding protein
LSQRLSKPLAIRGLANFHCAERAAFDVNLSSELTKHMKRIIDRDEAHLPQAREKLLGSRECSGLLLHDKIYFSDPGGERHAHSNTVLCIVLQGACTETHGNKIRDYAQFNSEFLPPDQVHSLKFHSPVTRCLSIEIAPAWIERAKDHGLRLPKDAVQFRGGLLRELFLRIHRELRIHDDASQLAIQGLSAEMLAHVSRLSLSTRHRPQWLHRVQDLLHGNFANPLTISELANEVGVHPAHLSRQFRKYFGQTIGQYMRELRIGQTMRELTQSTASIVGIGVAAGFADQSHFCRVFRSRTGMTPGEFRRTFGVSSDIRNSREVSLEQVS